MKLLKKLSETNLSEKEIRLWIIQWYLAARKHKELLLGLQARLIREDHPAFSLLAAITADELGLGIPEKNHVVLLANYLHGLGIDINEISYIKHAIPAIKCFAEETREGWVEQSTDFAIGLMRYFEEIGDEIHKAYFQAVTSYEKANPNNRDLSYFSYHGGGAEEEHAKLLLRAKDLCKNQDEEEAGYAFGKEITTPYALWLFPT